MEGEVVGTDDLTGLVRVEVWLCKCLVAEVVARFATQCLREEKMGNDGLLGTVWFRASQ